MDPTRAVYTTRAREWESRRGPDGHAAAFAARLAPGDRPVADLGCGPGWDLATLGHPGIGLDASAPFVRRITAHAPGAWAVQADLRHLPFRRRSLGAAWASRSYVHLARTELPMALWDLHRSLREGSPVRLRLFAGDAEHEEWPDDPFSGRRFSRWGPDHLRAVVSGAGFEQVGVTVEAGSDLDAVVVDARRGRTLADTVGSGMRMLVVGLNPSWYSADRGVPFARPGNRFWPAALAAGVVARDRDPAHALGAAGVGMTDLVKRATARAAELEPAEFRAGLARLEMLVDWLRPGVVCVVGVTGWRLATGDRTARLGRQPRPLAARPVVVLPNPSGANAHTDVDDLSRRLREAAEIAGSTPPRP